MKIAIPVNEKQGLESPIAKHFGRSLAYVFLDEQGEEKETLDNISEHGGGKGLPPELLKEKKADIVLCVDLGPRAVKLCQELGVEVYIDKEAKTVKEIFHKWKDNKIKKASEENACLDHKK